MQVSLNQKVIWTLKLILNCSPDLHGKVSAMEESGRQGVEQLREELQKEKKVIEQQGEVVNGLVNGDLPACHTKIADLEAALRSERSERESEATSIRETVAKNREDLAESLEKDRAEVQDRMEEDTKKGIAGDERNILVLLFLYVLQVCH